MYQFQTALTTVLQPKQNVIADTTFSLLASPAYPLPCSARQSMGFERAAVLQALHHTGNDQFAAANFLVSRADSGGGGGGSGGGTGEASSPGGGGSEGAGVSGSEPGHHHAS